MIRFSIVIPTRNRPDRLRRCLAAIEQLRYPKDRYEVVVIPDDSDPPLGPAKARNLGMKRAVGEYVVFTDDDCRPAPDWLQAFDQAIASDPAAAFGGAVVDDGTNGLFASTSQLLITYLYEYQHGHPERKRFYCTNNVVFPRQPLIDAGGFDERFRLAAAEDRDLCSRWSELYPLRFAEEAIVYHDQQIDLLSFWRQQFRYGRGAFHYSKSLRERGQSGVRVEPIAFYVGMLSFPFRQVGSLRGLLASALIGVSQFANAAGFLNEKAASGERRHRANP
jgi:GT2 family glycosyltransferase